MTTEQMEALEQSVNEKIRERIPVTVRELAADDPEVETVSDGSEGNRWLSTGPKHLQQGYWFVCHSPALLGEKPRLARWPHGASSSCRHWRHRLQHVLWDSCLQPEWLAGRGLQLHYLQEPSAHAHSSRTAEILEIRGLLEIVLEGKWAELTTYEGTSKIPFSFSNQVVLLFKVIKLICTEKGKKNKTNLVFLAGNRVLKSVEQSHRTEKALTSLLK